MAHLVAIDQGTTGSTVLVLDEALSVRGRGYREFPQHYPEPGHVEHEPEQIWQSVTGALADALAQAFAGRSPTRDDLLAIGLTNQRETVVLWRRDGTPAHRAIVWQDRRTAPQCAALAAAGHGPRLRALTGLPIDPYFSASKLAFLLDSAGHRAAAERGELCFGTVDSFVLHRLTGGVVHATDVTNASRTQLFDIHRLCWSDELLALFRVPAALLPDVRQSAAHFGETRGVPGLPDGLPITGIAGDQHAALFGQSCFEPGMAKCTYGTGAFLLMHTGERPVPSTSGLVTTLAWQLPGEIAYALEGSAFVAGAAMQWLRDGLGLIADYDEAERLARSVPDSAGVVVVPAFAGLGAPHWRPDARALVHGLTRGVTKAHLVRAVLEGIALQNVDLLRAMERDSGRDLRELKVDGGAAANDVLMQFQSDVLGVTIHRPRMVEATALGAAMLAGIGVGLFRDRAAVPCPAHQQRTFTPAMPKHEVEAHLARWAKAIASA